MVIEDNIEEVQNTFNQVEKTKAPIGDVVLKFTMAFIASAVVVYFTGYFFEKGSIAANK